MRQTTKKLYLWGKGEGKDKRLILVISFLGVQTKGLNGLEVPIYMQFLPTQKNSMLTNSYLHDKSKASLSYSQINNITVKLCQKLSDL